MNQPRAEEPTTRLIINADDFGLRPEVNRAVLRAHRDGRLSSASLLVNAPGTAEAVGMARDLPQLGLGLHLALTELAPLTHCPHLAPGGSFPDSHGTVYRRLLARRVPEREIRDEVTAQLEAALATGLPLDHVDGHGHVHLLPGVLEAVVAAGRELGVTALRWPLEQPWEPPGLHPGAGGRVRRRLLAWLCARGEAVVVGWRRPAAFFGLAVSGQMTAPRLQAAAAAAPAGLSEIMVHPAERDEVAYPGYLGAAELAALTTAEVARGLPPLGRFSDLGL